MNHYLYSTRNLSAPTLRYLLEDEREGGDSSLKGEFGDFASYEPPGIKSSLCSPHFALESYGENSHTIPDHHYEVNSSISKEKIPLKAGFDDFDINSVMSSKNTLDLPCAEDNMNSIAEDVGEISAKSILVEKNEIFNHFSTIIGPVDEKISYDTKTETLNNGFISGGTPT